MKISWFARAALPRHTLLAMDSGALAAGRRHKKKSAVTVVKKAASSPSSVADPNERQFWMRVLVGLGLAVLAWRALSLHVMHGDFLQSQGDARLQRVVPIMAHRGMFLDRNGEPLAISTPVDSVWVNPGQFAEARARWPELGKALGMDPQAFDSLLEGRMQREFVYLKRHVSPDVSARIKALDVSGVFLQREYHRYYPAAEVTAHVLGFTDIDDKGQEGLELAFEDTLRGVPGSKRIIQDGRGRTIADVESLSMPRPGQDMQLSIDRRIQYLAYRELAAAVRQHGARGGSAVVLDARSGEILAMVNQPGYNPNKPEERKSSRFRNRAATDVFEPGSTVKPFTVAAALESGKYSPGSYINTSPGRLKIGKYTINDAHNYKSLDLTGIIKKSSNVGASKIALSLAPQQQWQILAGVGFGEAVGSGFPGEVSGRLPHYSKWRSSLTQATLSYGYGLNVNLLQLARAYGALANDGKLLPLRLTHAAEDEAAPQAVQAMQPETARQVRTMLETVVSKEGTAPAAAVAGYRVGGKTGTARKAGAGGYAAGHYQGLFVGMAPLGSPRLVMAVLIDEPKGSYYGGVVAAPVFSKVMSGALRLLDIPPDNLEAAAPAPSRKPRKG